jgi:hypothetical protein
MLSLHSISDNKTKFLTLLSSYILARISIGKFLKMKLLGQNIHTLIYFQNKYCQIALQNVPNAALRQELKSVGKELSKKYGWMWLINSHFSKVQD